MYVTTYSLFVNNMPRRSKKPHKRKEKFVTWMTDEILVTLV